MREYRLATNNMVGMACGEELPGGKDNGWEHPRIARVRVCLYCAPSSCSTSPSKGGRGRQGLRERQPQNVRQAKRVLPEVRWRCCSTVLLWSMEQIPRWCQLIIERVEKNQLKIFVQRKIFVLDTFSPVTTWPSLPLF